MVFEPSFTMISLGHKSKILRGKNQSQLAMTRKHSHLERVYYYESEKKIV